MKTAMVGLRPTRSESRPAKGSSTTKTIRHRVCDSSAWLRGMPVARLA